jgi:hypothetical protein
MIIITRRSRSISRRPDRPRPTLGIAAVVDAVALVAPRYRQQRAHWALGAAVLPRDYLPRGG